MEKSEEADVVVIGAGISGIAFARFYLEIHPNCRLVILEAERSVGGTWCAARNHAEFWAQCSPRMASFSDDEIILPHGAPTYQGMFEAKYVTQYLEKYVETHCYAGQTLRDRIRLGHHVREAEKHSGQWHILANVDGGGKDYTIASSKLVVATGRTSNPKIPPLLNVEQYKGLLLHHRDFGPVSRELRESEKHRHVVVLGGGKSASDMAYEAAKSGCTVSWVIRKSGEGPGIFSSVEAQKNSYKNGIEKETTRSSQAFSPSSFMPEISWWRLIQRMPYGRRRIFRRMGKAHQRARAIARYRDRPGALPGFEKLDFEGSSWWLTAPVGVSQRDDFWDTIAQKVRVYRNDIDHMTSDSVILDDGTEIQADMVLYGTGWKSSYTFFSDKLAASLGLPHDPKLDSPSESADWARMLEEADAKVLRRFPMLARPPPHLRADNSGDVVDDDNNHGHDRGSEDGDEDEDDDDDDGRVKANPTSSYSTTPTTTRLYRCIAPLPPAGEENGLKARSVAFVGHGQVGDAFRAAEAAAVWTTAWFDGHVRCPPLAHARRAVAYMNAFSRRRYPARGAAGDCLMWESLAYTDRLLDDVGLRSHRARKGLIGRWLEPCVASDFRDVPEEYRKRFEM